MTIIIYPPFHPQPYSTTLFMWSLGQLHINMSNISIWRDQSVKITQQENKDHAMLPSKEQVGAQFQKKFKNTYYFSTTSFRVHHVLKRCYYRSNWAHYNPPCNEGANISSKIGGIRLVSRCSHRKIGWWLASYWWSLSQFTSPLIYLHDIKGISSAWRTSDQNHF